MKRIKLLIYKMYLYIMKKLKGNGVFYINGPDTLPPPLTKDEESDAFKMLSENNSSARETLIVHNLRLVVYIAKKFESTGTGVEDLISIGTIGLIKAVNTFKPDKNIKLATYASRCIENEILTQPHMTSSMVTSPRTGVGMRGSKSPNTYFSKMSSTP